MALQIELPVQPAMGVFDEKRERERQKENARTCQQKRERESARARARERERQVGEGWGWGGGVRKGGRKGRREEDVQAGSGESRRK